MISGLAGLLLVIFFCIIAIKFFSYLLAGLMGIVAFPYFVSKNKELHRGYRIAFIILWGLFAVLGVFLTIALTIY